MEKEELKKMGSMQQIAYVRRVKHLEGRAEGMKVLEVKAGELYFTAAEDKCLDIIELSYKGINLNFLSKPGIQNRQTYDMNGYQAQKSIMGGLFFTCGTDNVGTPDLTEESPLPMHGSLRSTPAEHVCGDAFWENDSYKIRISGEMRQAQLFGGNVVLRRTIEIQLGSNIIHIHDEFENQSFEEAPFMILYHFNAGYPLLDEGCKVQIPSKKAVLREESNENKATVLPWQEVCAPIDGTLEQVFFHDTNTDEQGNTFASVVNEKLGLGLKIHFNKNQLPRLTQWKSMASGDYAMGLEPCNCFVNGQQWEREYGDLKTLKSSEKRCIDIKIEILDLN